MVAIFADTVTPDIFSPFAETIVPLRRLSACASVVASSSESTRRIGPPRLIGTGNGLEIGNDRIDLCWFEVIPEARHLGAAVADEGAHRLVVAAERRARKCRAVLHAGRLRLGMADAARLVEKPHA